MFRILITRVLIMSLVLVLASADVFGQTRIRFAKGSSATEVEGSIAKKGKRTYLINVKAGQRMLIEVTAGNQNVLVQVNGLGYRVDNPDASNFWEGEMQGGDYRITLYNDGKATKVKMGVSVQ